MSWAEESTCEEQLCAWSRINNWKKNEFWNWVRYWHILEYIWGSWYISQIKNWLYLDSKLKTISGYKFQYPPSPPTHISFSFRTSADSISPQPDDLKAIQNNFQLSFIRKYEQLLSNMYLCLNNARIQDFEKGRMLRILWRVKRAKFF